MRSLSDGIKKMVLLSCGNETNVSICDPADATISGLAGFGTDLGAFLTNLLPGVVGFVLILAIIGGLIAIFNAIAGAIRKAIKK